MGTILKTYLSINQNFEQNYILCRNFRLIRLGGGVLRLREVFQYGTRINTKIMNHIAAQLIHKSPIKLFNIIEKIKIYWISVKNDFFLSLGDAREHPY